MMLFSSLVPPCTRILTMSRPRAPTNDRTHRHSVMASHRPPDRPRMAHGIRFMISTHQVASGDGPREGMTGVCSTTTACAPTCITAMSVPSRPSGFASFSFVRIRLSRDAGVGWPLPTQHNGSSTRPRHAYLLIARTMRSVDERMPASRVHKPTTGATCASLARNRNLLQRRETTDRLRMFTLYCLKCACTSF
jgi:hypothetical protein